MITVLKTIWGVMSALPIILEKLDQLEKYMRSQEFQRVQDNISTIAKQIEGAETHEERINLAATLSDAESEL